jgi:hypothetical protein
MLKQLSLILLIALLGCNSDTSDNHSTDSVNFPLRMKFSTIGGQGIFDPSVALDPSTDTLWMSYSQVHQSVMWPDANPEVVGIRLASSTDGGKSWSDSGIDLSEAHDVTAA